MSQAEAHQPVVQQQAAEEVAQQPAESSFQRLLNGIPPFVPDYMTGRAPPGVEGMVPFHWRSGQEMEAASDKALQLFTGGREGAGGTQEQTQQQQHQQQGTDGAAGESEFVDEMRRSVYEQAAATAGSFQQVEIVGEDECGNPECGKRAEEGQTFPKCARCGLAYCSKECQRIDWRNHKLACYPERLRLHVPLEAEMLYSIKRMAISNLVPLLLPELSLAAVAWHERLGKGLVVVACNNWVYLHSPDGRDKCQLYAFWFPESDVAAQVTAVPGLKGVLEAAGGAKKLYSAFDPETHLSLLFIDTDFQLSLRAGLAPPKEFCQQVLAESSPELRSMDVLCIDVMTGDRAMIDFHSMSTVEEAAAPDAPEGGAKEAAA